MLSIKRLISFTILLFILSGNTSFAADNTVSSDFINKSTPIETLVTNALALETPLTLDEILALLPESATAEDRKSIEDEYYKQIGGDAAAAQGFAAPKKSTRSYSSTSGGGNSTSPN